MGCGLRCICAGQERHQTHFVPAGAILAHVHTAVFINGYASFADNMALGYGGKNLIQADVLMQNKLVTRLKQSSTGHISFVLCYLFKRCHPLRRP